RRPCVPAGSDCAPSARTAPRARQVMKPCFPTTRHKALAGLDTLSVAGCGGSGENTFSPVSFSSSPKPARTSPQAPSRIHNTLAARQGRRWGSAVAWNAGTTGGSIQNPEYTAIIRNECGIVVPENEMKWQWTRPGPETFDFSRMDAIAAWAQAN